ncbi:type IV secretion system protein [Thiovibrio frasassiensis]|uniref:Type IV secretion system protein n=1 Tax=Thiovibrio frasassiensis TaxID=2984131 RepID=A0A9X4MFB2_9BACT|nr:type IV secretion system protein [Thiovibrio frasassiensis]MDG4475602.1 type IV secretion system protein [Thiovibrio frasassiensis]
MPTTDVQAYTYYVKQIAEAQKQLAEAQKQVDTLGGIKTTADKTQRAVMGNYNRAKGLVDDLQRVRKKLEATPTTIQGSAKKWLSVGDAGLEVGEDGFYAVGKILDTHWVDPRDLKKSAEKLKHLDQIYQVKQASLRGNIEASDEILRTMPQRLKTIEGLVEQIDQTENIKDAQDLSNRFLAEILKVLAEMSAIAAKIGESYALMNYQGVSEATMQQRMQTQSGGSGSTEGWAARDLRKKGYDPQNMTGKDFRKILNAEE